ncbi:MAG: ATP-binding protein [Candidatus Nanopelagicales bacterium]
MSTPAIIADLNSLRDYLQADLLVISQLVQVNRAVVVDCVPALSIANGQAWTTHEYSGREPVRLMAEPATQSGLLPAAFRLTLPPVLAAVAVLPLAEGALTAVWAERPPPPDAGEILTRVRPLCAGLLAVGAAVRKADYEQATLESVLAGISKGVLISDATTGRVRLNAGSMRLLGFDHSEIPATQLAPALQALRERATNAAELAETADRVLRTPGAMIRDWIWRFDSAPTHLDVSTYPLDGGLPGRVWLFRDASAEQQLRDSEQRFRLLAENASDVIWRIDSAGIVNWVSPSVREVLGFEQEALLGIDLGELISRDDLAVSPTGRAWPAGHHSGDDVQVRIRRQDDTWLWVSLRWRTLPPDSGSAQIVTSMSNVDGLVAARKQALAGQTLLQSTLDSMLDPHILLRPVRDEAGQIVDYLYLEANKAACDDNGMKLADVRGRRLGQLFPAMRQNKLWKLYEQVITTGQPTLIDGHLMHNDLRRAERYYDVRLVPVSGDLSCTWRDVTERTEEGQLLTESRAAYAEMAENRNRLLRQLPVGVFRVRAHGDHLAVIDFLSERAGELLGVPTEVAKYDFQAIAAAIHPDDLPALAAALVASTSTGSALSWEGRTRARSGGVDQWLHIEGSPQSLPDGQSALEGIVQDISIPKNYERELVVARGEAVRAAAAQSAFLANMSHEIRTPLTAVLGLLRLLRDSGLNSAQSGYASRAERAAQNLLALLNDVLDFSKIEAGSLLLDPHPANLDAMLADVGVVMSSNLAGKPLELLFDVDSELPATTVFDEMRLRQILVNLTGNAVKFTSEGEVVLRVCLISRDESSATVGFSVRDTGIGMSPETLATVFDGFTQADASIARRYGGSGLGMAISSRLVEQMGGRLEVASTLGVGTVFTFRLDLPWIPEEHSGIDRLVGLNVLLVTARATAADILTRMCRGLGWAVTVTGTDRPLAALRAALTSRRPFDLVLFDRPAGQHDRADLPGSFRRACRGHPVPTLIELGGQHQAGTGQSSSHAPDAVLLKPFTPSNLLDTVTEAILGRTRPPRAAPANDWRLAGRLSGIRILLAEDNAVNRDVVTEMLEREGAVITPAVDGAEAVAAVSRAPDLFDLVLMDMQLPVMDGLTATRAIRTQYSNDELPIVAITANASPSERRACLDAGMDDHVRKPFDFDLLVERILRWSRAGARTPTATEVTPIEPKGAMLDVGAACARLGGDTEFYRRMLAKFASKLPVAVAAISEAAAASDCSQLAHAAHSLKGSAATIGADCCADAASQLEESAKSIARCRADDPLVCGLLDLAAATADAIAEWLDRPDQDPVHDEGAYSPLGAV